MTGLVSLKLANKNRNHTNVLEFVGFRLEFDLTNYCLVILICFCWFWVVIFTI